jgi:hypothetical protein
VNTKIRPGVAILIVIAALGAIFGFMWFQSEAPKLNKLPHPMGMGPPSKEQKPSAPGKSPAPSQQTDTPKAEKPSETGGK